MSLAAKRVMCWIRGHDWGRWRRLPLCLRQRKCKRCFTLETAEAAPPRKRQANPADTITVGAGEP